MLYNNETNSGEFGVFQKPHGDAHGLLACVCSSYKHMHSYRNKFTAIGRRENDSICPGLLYWSINNPQHAR
jgi:hypothetical protein